MFAPPPVLRGRLRNEKRLMHVPPPARPLSGCLQVPGVILPGQAGQLSHALLDAGSHHGLREMQPAQE
jgi:hypothetical protein